MNTQHPRDDHGYGNAPTPPPAESQADAESMNTYTRRYNDAAAPDLDAGAPHLASGSTHRLSRRAMVLLGGFTFIALALVALVYNAIGNRTTQAPVKREEAVTVPDAPKAPPPMPTAPKQAAEAIPLKPNSPSSPDSRTPQASLPRTPSLMERRLAEASNSLAQTNAPDMGAATPRMATEPADATSAQPLNHPDQLMLRGTYIRCVLETRIITDIPGFTSCVVTEPVYAFTGHTLLLPKGSKVFGKYSQEPNGPRVAVIWDRIVTPTGIDVNMSSPGVDNLGGSGHPGDYNAHWPSRIGAALMISLLGDAFKYEAAKHGPPQTTVTNGVVTQMPFESNTAKTVQSIAEQAVQRAANRPATVTIHQGTVLNVYVARDVDFSGVVARFTARDTAGTQHSRNTP